ncbi:MAG: Minf_1886 family protein [Planctomycetota bacterium]|nr:Minf_1886 family protein [Planctomycetota bacterium]
MNDALRKLALQDGRYSPEAFRFLYESLEHALRLTGREHAEGTDRHVTGREVLDGMRACATQQFGPLAAHVWRSWGVKESLDWGRIVFLLVEHKMLKRQDGDKLEDFAEGFDFDEVFERSYRPQVPKLQAGGGEG